MIDKLFKNFYVLLIGSRKWGSSKLETNIVFLMVNLAFYFFATNKGSKHAEKSKAENDSFQMYELISQITFPYKCANTKTITDSHRKFKLNKSTGIDMILAECRKSISRGCYEKIKTDPKCIGDLKLVSSPDVRMYRPSAET